MKSISKGLTDVTRAFEVVITRAYGFVVQLPASSSPEITQEIQLKTCPSPETTQQIQTGECTSNLETGDEEKQDERVRIQFFQDTIIATQMAGTQFLLDLGKTHFRDTVIPTLVNIISLQFNDDEI